MKLKVGDTRPSLTIDLTNAGDPIDLTLADTVTVVGTQGLETVVNDSAPTVDDVAGTVTHEWVTGETDTAGRIWLHVAVEWSDGTTQTFPPYGELAVDVEP